MEAHQSLDCPKPTTAIHSIWVQRVARVTAAGVPRGGVCAYLTTPTISHSTLVHVFADECVGGKEREGEERGEGSDNTTSFCPFLHAPHAPHAPHAHHAPHAGISDMLCNVRCVCTYQD